MSDEMVEEPQCPHVCKTVDKESCEELMHSSTSLTDKEDIPAVLSKNQRKKLIKMKRWEENKPLKRLI